MINKIELGYSNSSIFCMHVAHFPYSITRNQTFIKALVDMMVLQRL